MQKIDDNIVTQMRKGIMEYCFLIILSRQRAYPSEIIRKLSEVNLEVKEATVYTILSRLAKEGKISYSWTESTMGPPRKYFNITDLGRNALVTISRVWDNMSSTIEMLRCDDSDNKEER